MNKLYIAVVDGLIMYSSHDRELAIQAAARVAVQRRGISLDIGTIDLETASPVLTLRAAPYEEWTDEDYGDALDYQWHITE